MIIADVVFVTFVSFPKMQEHKKGKACNNDTIEVNFGQEFKTSNLSVHKICQDYQLFGRIANWTYSYIEGGPIVNAYGIQGYIT